jgi:UDPglucose 6-dehydrogenase
MSSTISMPGTLGGARLIFQKQIKMEKIGIVGLGFVGGAINSAMGEYSQDADLILVDPFKGYTNTVPDLKDCSGVFICVPSPQGEDGQCDTSIMENVLAQLKAINYYGVIISKCTAPPNVYEQLNEDFPNLVHAPEFLVAATAVRDYINGEFAIIGGKVNAYVKEAERIIRLSQRHLKEVQYCSIGEASLAKYAINCFMSTKVIFMNELKQLADAMGLDYNTVIQMVKLDNRIGKSHMQVPGPDGAFGFGGACFPKDTSAMLKYAEQYNVQLNVLDAAVKKNTILRLTEPK